MIQEPDPDLMLLYVAGATDDEECATCDELLSAASPEAQAAYAEAMAIFHAMPLCLECIEPPSTVRQAILGRIAAEASQTSPSYITRLRWPLYVSSGLAACLAVGLTLSIWNNRRLSEDNEQMAAAIETGRDVLSSPHVTLASLQTNEKTPSANKSFGRVLFCPVSRQYQFTVFNLPPLPVNKKYELWLITADGRKSPAGTFVVNEGGSATVAAHCNKSIDAANAAITDEPAEGSEQPTGSIHLIGALQSSR